MNADLGRRRIRRPLTPEEFDLLLEAAESGCEIQSISGPDRAVLYIVGAYTGYRRNEIASVTRDSFDFESDPPTLTVEAGYSKHRRTDVLPLRRDFADRIQTWTAGKEDLLLGEPLFSVADKRTAEMIRKDLDAARAKWLRDAKNDAERLQREETSFLLYKNHHGHVVDFHSLRSTFITNLTRSGVSPKTAQSLARHSDINLTMNVYTKLDVLDHASAVESLPPIPGGSNTSEAERATGTYGPTGTNDAPKKVPTMVPRGAQIGAEPPAPATLQIAPGCTERRSGEVTTRSAEDAKSSEKTRTRCASTDVSASTCNQVPEVGLEPTRPCGHWILNPARLPIPPLRRAFGCAAGRPSLEGGGTGQRDGCLASWNRACDRRLAAISSLQVRADSIALGRIAEVGPGRSSRTLPSDSCAGSPRRAWAPSPVDEIGPPS